MIIEIDPELAEPLFEQIASAIRSAVARGDAKDGERLPAAKVLAEELDVNLHTVLRAYALLRDEGVLSVRPRRGAVVTGTGRNRARTREAAQRLVAEAKRQGMAFAEVGQLVKELW